MFASNSTCFHFLNTIPFFITFLLIIMLTLSPSLVHTLSFNISDFEDAKSAGNMAYQGSASTTNGSIALGAGDANEVGNAMYGQPLRLWDPTNNVLTNFTTKFSFTIDPLNNNSLGDGFAFYMAPLGFQIPPNSIGGCLGLFNVTTKNGVPQNHIISVEFDTYVNTFDPNMLHVGINNNSIKSLVTKRFGSDDTDIRKQCHALISYNANNQTLSVFWFFSDDGNNGSVSDFWQNNYSSLSYKINLMETLPEFVVVGFSAATGSFWQSNIIHSWEFISTLNSTDSKVIRKPHKWKVVLATAVSSSVVLVLLVAMICHWSMNKKRKTNNVTDNNNIITHTLVFYNDPYKVSIPRRFDYKELVTATNGFSDDKKLGRGGSGQVYKGVLNDLGRVVAVKRIFAESQNSEKIFINEVKIISRLIHKNLVQFIGWCHEKREFLLVFEYMPNGSLDTHLFGNKRILAWDVRYKIALGMARAIHYLHENAELCVLHRDIKSANVLLDTDFSTKVGDFGMAKLVDPRLRTSQGTGVVGTYGYLAPEYINGGRASKESDMYSFGVVALEIASGRRTYRDGEFHVPLTNWIWQLYAEGNVLKCVDEGLNGNFDENEMKCLIMIGLWCTNPNDKERPKAEQVIKVLQFESPLPLIPLDMHDKNHRATIGEARFSFQSTPITSSFISDGR